MTDTPHVQGIVAHGRATAARLVAVAIAAAGALLVGVAGPTPMPPVMSAALWLVATTTFGVAAVITWLRRRVAAAQAGTIGTIATRLIDPVSDHLAGDLAAWWDQADIEQRGVACIHAARMLQTAETFAKEGRYPNAAAWLRSGRASALLGLVGDDTGLAPAQTITLAVALSTAFPKENLDEYAQQVTQAVEMLQPGR